MIFHPPPPDPPALVAREQRGHTWTLTLDGTDYAVGDECTDFTLDDQSVPAADFFARVVRIDRIDFGGGRVLGLAGASREK